MKSTLSSFSLSQAVCATIISAGMLLSPHASLSNLITFEFSPNELVDLYSTSSETRAVQDNPRLLIDNTIPTAFAATFTDFGNQPSFRNTYENWLEGLGDDEGISAFSTFITLTPLVSWNQTLIRDGSNGTTATGISFTTGGGWNAGIAFVGDVAVVQWWTDNPTLYLRPGGVNLGTFSFSMEDTNAQIGESYRVWFGTQSMVFDDQGWGTRTPAASPYNEFDTGGTGFQGVLTASAVPEPGTFSLLVIGSLLTLVARRKLTQPRT
ncbi:MAG TPA: PEP-CTERM sorting domain-containing protein [Kiritimatiellia bacterium]|nr:PEP-CTERM sorting domain-containing protein [Kiritimatiellia bacterium]